MTACSTSDIPSRHTGIDQVPLIETSVLPQDGAGATTVISTPEAVVDRQVVERPADEEQDDPVAAIASPVSVHAVQVRVPRSLKVSERNRYLPFGDIVWREDPIGDRHAQVQKIMQDALMHGVTPLEGPGKVDVEVELVRFHAITEKARYTTGGVHAITFDLTLRDPETAAMVVPQRRIRADLEAYGGQQAVNAEALGVTQKARISEHLSDVIRQELTSPEGYQNAKLGVFQLLNNL
ncbi:hypothetical protein Q5Y75_02170 [Ruegeria sp. 2205SS24-7]|uniref:DUF6778 family protein n=1 Tax=Ruegeria discodermiae TaxID=3064389 RepID=UPI002740E275|nr:DUF6778 family protein [Ruegeria sp. 2205SS24-7]MDP5216014.1 hypothetical protein [Ruegeria sp. 2205SS24-7]